jgi:cyanide dihydratase
MAKEYAKFTGAAVQSEPVYLGVDATVDKAGQNEQVHVASWPGSDLFPEDVEIGSRCYAMSTQTDVLMCSNIYGPVTAAKICETPEQEKFYNELSKCRAAIFGPAGKPVSPVHPPLEEGIAYGEIDLAKIIDQKYCMDPAGHYSNGDLTMVVDRTRQPVDVSP